MWAVKGHYFTAYYNWPYTFGLLFGIGLYAEFQRDPERFRLGYDDLLSATGLGEAAELAARFGIDVRSVDVLDGQPRRAAWPHRRVRRVGRRRRSDAACGAGQRPCEELDHRGERLEVRGRSRALGEA